MAVVALAAVSLACGGAPSTSGEPQAEPTATRDANPNKVTTDGTLAVGVDIEAGTWRTTVPEDSPICYWARLRSTDGSFGAIIANGNANPGAKLTVTIKRTDKAFETNGCGTWTKA